MGPIIPLEARAATPRTSLDLHRAGAASYLMATFSRRAFLGTLAAAIPAAGLVRHAHAAAVDELAAGPRTLHALAQCVLPSELSPSQLSATVRDFQRWIAGYRANVEMVHGYGTSALERTRSTPATVWARQLDALEVSARRVHRRSFADVTPAQRQQLVQADLDALDATRIPSLARATHVALAVLAHFYGSAVATDMCYEASIARQTCRPLGTSGRKPLPLARRGGA